MKKDIEKVATLFYPLRKLMEGTLKAPLEIPSYRIESGIRHVQPYFQHIKTTVKSRWLNRSVLDVLSTEFRSFSISQYRSRMEKNEISVLHRQKLTKKERKERCKDNLRTDDRIVIRYPEILKYKMADNDIIERLEHIHERSVCATRAQELEVIHEDDELLVVSKPSGIPIHPVQNYYYNSFVQILQIEGWPGRKEESKDIQLRPCHRLDKLTSGICMFAKSAEAARKIQTKIQDRTVEKTYLARVKGKFPGVVNMGQIDQGEDIKCCDDIVVFDTKKGKNDGVMKKTAMTVFRSLKYNKELDESIVMCWPKTGRTHQIRIHLRNMRHPIVNDPLYGFNRLLCLENTGGDPSNISDEYFQRIEKQAAEKRSEAESGESCHFCEGKLYTQTEKDDLIMYLHAYKYQLDAESGWQYQTKWPEWCNI